MKRNGKDLLFYLAMTGPAVGLYFLVVAFPVISSILLGFTKYNIYDPSQTTFAGLAMYTRMFEDPLFWQAFRNNIVVVIVSVFGQIPIGFILAYIIYRRMINGSHFYQSMVFLPYFISTIIVGILWKRIFGPNGPVATLIQWISGNPEAQFTMSIDPATAMVPIGLVLIWMYTGFYMIVFLANLQKIDTGLIEAAQIDGASETKIFLRIAFPMLSGIVLVNTILAIAGSLRGFDLIWAMTGGGPANFTIVLPIYMYKFAFQQPEIDAFSFGSAISNMIVLFSIVLILISNAVGKWFNAGTQED